MGSNKNSGVRPDLGTPAQTKSARNATNLDTKSRRPAENARAREHARIEQG